VMTWRGYRKFVCLFVCSFFASLHVMATATAAAADKDLSDGYSSNEDSSSINCYTLSPFSDEDDLSSSGSDDLDLSTVSVKCDCCKQYVCVDLVPTYDERMFLFFQLNARIAEVCCNVYDLFTRAHRLRAFFPGKFVKFILGCEAWFQRYIFRMGLITRASASIPAPYVVCRHCFITLDGGIKAIDTNAFRSVITDDDEI